MFVHLQPSAETIVDAAIAALENEDDDDEVRFDLAISHQKKENGRERDRRSNASTILALTVSYSSRP